MEFILLFTSIIYCPNPLHIGHKIQNIEHMKLIQFIEILSYYSNMTFQSYTQNKRSLVKMSGLLNAMTKVATGCLRVTKDSTFAVF